MRNDLIEEAGCARRRLVLFLSMLLPVTLTTSDQSFSAKERKLLHAFFIVAILSFAFKYALLYVVSAKRAGHVVLRTTLYLQTLPFSLRFHLVLAARVSDNNNGMYRSKNGATTLYRMNFFGHV